MSYYFVYDDIRKIQVDAVICPSHDRIIRYARSLMGDIVRAKHYFNQRGTRGNGLSFRYRW